jgi:hypothetical protein
MATSKSVSVVFSASTAGLKAGTDSARAQLQKLSGDVKRMSGSLSTLSTIAVAGVFMQVGGAAFGAAKQLIGFGAATAQNIDKLSKMGRTLGLTYGQMAGLQLAGDLAGVGVETIAKAAVKADIAFVAAAGGSEEAIEKFTNLGLSMADLKTMSPEQRFTAIAEAISKLPTAAERSAAAVKMFGKSGAELLPLFEDGAAGIKKATEQAEKFGLVLSNEQGKEVEKMNDSFTSAYAAIQGIVTQVVANLSPAITSIVEKFTEFVAGAGGVKLGESISTALIDGAIFVVEMFGVAANFISAYVIEPMGGVVGILSAAWAVGTTVANVFMGVVNALKAAFLFAASIMEHIAANYLQAISTVLSFIPGMGDTAEQFKAAGDSMRESANQSMTDAGTAAVASADNFSAAINGGSADAVKAATEGTGNSIADSIANGLREARETAAAAKLKPDTVEKPIDTTAADKAKAEMKMKEDQKTAAEKIGNKAAKEDPLEVFRTSLKTLDDALASGAISQEDFNSRFSNIQTDLTASYQDALDEQADSKGVSKQAVTGVDANSTAGVSEFFRLMRGAEPPGAKEQRETAENTARLRELAEAAAAGVPIPVQLMPKGG